MAHPARFERAAFRLGGERSILLSYGCMYSVQFIMTQPGGVVKFFRMVFSGGFSDREWGMGRSGSA